MQSVNKVSLLDSNKSAYHTDVHKLHILFVYHFYSLCFCIKCVVKADMNASDSLFSTHSTILKALRCNMFC